MVRATRKKEQNNASIKTYLHVVECVNATKTFNKIEKTDDSICPKMNYVTDFYKTNNRTGEIITDQPCQITETRCNSPMTPHRIKLDIQPITRLHPFLPKTNKTARKIKEPRTLKEYFPVRRSNRKTKKIVLEERKQSIEDAINMDEEVGLEIRHFENKGRGIVTTQKFLRGDFVVEYRGELIDDIEAKRREQMYARDQNAGCYMYYFKYQARQYCIDATKETKFFGRLVNHSRNGNLITRIEVFGGKPHLVLIAKDDIEVGEEITYDYGDRSKESLIHHPWLAQ